MRLISRSKFLLSILISFNISYIPTFVLGTHLHSRIILDNQLSGGSISNKDRLLPLRGPVNPYLQTSPPLFLRHHHHRSSNLPTSSDASVPAYRRNRESECLIYRGLTPFAPLLGHLQVTSEARQATKGPHRSIALSLRVSQPLYTI